MLLHTVESGSIASAPRSMVAYLLNLLRHGRVVFIETERANAMNRKDWTLLAICSANGNGLSPVQLQKALFLLSREMPNAVGNFYHFTAYHYGPFDRAVYDDAERLAADGMV